MLSGRSSRTLIKAYSTSGKSLSEKFWLYEDGVAQYSFETDINGWAMINFIPSKRQDISGEEIRSTGVFVPSISCHYGCRLVC